MEQRELTEFAAALALDAEEAWCRQQVYQLASDAEFKFAADEVAQEAARKRQSVAAFVPSWSSPLPRASSVFVPRRPRLDAVLLARAGATARRQQRPRERRFRRTSRVVGSRGDPSEPGDDEPEDLSPPQAGFLAFLNGLPAASKARP